MCDTISFNEYVVSVKVDASMASHWVCVCVCLCELGAHGICKCAQYENHTISVVMANGKRLTKEIRCDCSEYVKKWGSDRDRTNISDKW